MGKGLTGLGQNRESARVSEAGGCGIQHGRVVLDAIPSGASLKLACLLGF